MTQEQQKVIDELRDSGYLVCIFEPSELRGADIDQVEEIMIERANYAIDDLCDENYAEEE